MLANGVRLNNGLDASSKVRGAKWMGVQVDKAADEKGCAKVMQAGQWREARMRVVQVGSKLLWPKT